MSDEQQQQQHSGNASVTCVCGRCKISFNGGRDPVCRYLCGCVDCRQAVAWAASLRAPRGPRRPPRRRRPGPGSPSSRSRSASPQIRDEQRREKVDLAHQHIEELHDDTDNWYARMTAIDRQRLRDSEATGGGDSPKPKSPKKKKKKAVHKAHGEDIGHLARNSMADGRPPDGKPKKKKAAKGGLNAPTKAFEANAVRAASGHRGS